MIFPPDPSVKYGLTIFRKAKVQSIPPVFLPLNLLPEDSEGALLIHSLYWSISSASYHFTLYLMNKSEFVALAATISEVKGTFLSFRICPLESFYIWGNASSERISSSLKVQILGKLLIKMEPQSDSETMMAISWYFPEIGPDMN